MSEVNMRNVGASQIEGDLKSSSFEVEDKARIAHTLNIVTLLLLGTLAVLSASFLLFSFPYPGGIVFLAISLILVIRLLMRLGWLRAASHMLPLSFWLIFSLVALTQDGVNSPVLRSYIIVIIVAGLLSGWRSAILFSGLCLLSVLLMYMAQVLWLWPSPLANQFLIGLFLSIPLAGILVTLATHGMEQAFRRARREITARRKAEEFLRRSQESLLEAQRIAHLGTLEWDLQTNELLWSDESYRLLGFAPQEIKPTVELFLACVHPEDRERVESTVNKIKAEAEAHPYEYRILRHDGEVRTIYSQPKVHCDEDGKVIRIFGTMLDVTELKQLEKQLLQAQKMEAVGRLAGGIAHDFNNILTGMMGYTELMRRQLPHDSKVEGDLLQLRDLAQRAKELTSQLLFFSRQQPVQERVLNLNTLIENTLTMLQRIIGEDLDLKFVPEPGLGNIRADEGQLGQVLLNLAVNARDAMPEGGELTIRTANVVLGDSEGAVQPGPYVLLTVTDSGQGMDEKIQQKVFDPFFTTKEVGQGTGLGLSTVHGIVQQHGGAITVSSEPGKGTTFKVYFPGVEAPVEKLPAEPREETLPPGSETVLVKEISVNHKAGVTEVKAHAGQGTLNG